MSLLLKDRVYTMQASTAKRGIYPMHGYKLGLYRMPIKLEDPAEIKSILEGMKKTFVMDKYADRIYATYNWIEENMPDPDADGYEYVDLSVTVEIVTGEVIDAIYQIYPVEKFSAPQWVQNYRKKADHFAKMIIEGNRVTVVNSEKIMISGRKKNIVGEYKEFLKIASINQPKHGPFHPRKPDTIISRMIRGMLPRDKPSGKAALSRLRVYIGVPKDVKPLKKTHLEKTKIRKPSALYTSVGELGRYVGWN